VMVLQLRRASDHLAGARLERGAKFFFSSSSVPFFEQVEVTVWTMICICSCASLTNGQSRT
jgi:hypothetical protein